MAFKTRNFYKLVRENGTDLYSGEVDYIDAIGHTIYLTDEEVNPSEARMCSPDVLHASVRLTDATRYRKRDHLHRVLVVHGTPVAKDPKNTKHGFRELDIIKEITDPQKLYDTIMEEGKKRVVPIHGRFIPQPVRHEEAVTLCRSTFLVCGWHPVVA